MVMCSVLQFYSVYGPLCLYNSCGQVWAWGSASKGQLGLGDLSHRSTPTCITSLNHMGVTKVVCGTHHTAALTIDGQVSSDSGGMM